MLIQSHALHDNDTCRRLVAAASAEFAQHGYAGARIRNIVEAAGVNLAAVNYYFGGKEGLYRATLGFLAGQAMKGLESTRGERRGQAPERQLHRLVYAFLAGLDQSPSSQPLGRILAHEAMDPSPHLDRLIEEMTRPQLERVRSVVRQLAGPLVPDAEVTLATLSVAGQCFIYQFGRPAIDRIFPGAIASPGATKRLSRRITEFSLAGIAELAAAYAGPAEPPTKPVFSPAPSPAGPSVRKMTKATGH